MELFEYDLKRKFEFYDIPVPDHVVASRSRTTFPLLKSVTWDCVLKPDGSRQRLPIYHRFTTFNSLVEAVNSLFHSDMTIRNILVERHIDAKDRLYVDLQADRQTGKIILNVRREFDDEVIEESVFINPFIHLREYQMRELSTSLNIDRVYWGRFQHLMQAVFTCYMDNDAELISLNPLAINNQDQFVVLNARMRIDPNALHRQSQQSFIQQQAPLSAFQQLAEQANIGFKPLGGNIACIVNGTGMGLAVLDAIYAENRTAARADALIDVGDYFQTEQINEAIKLSLLRRKVRVVIISLFGNYLDCNEIANAILQTYEGKPPNIPIIIRLAGPGAQNGLETLNRAEIANVFTETHLGTLITRATTIAATT